MFNISTSALKLWISALIFFSVAIAADSGNAFAAYDEKNFCNPDASTSLVLIDVTTRFDERSKGLFEEGILAVLGKMEDGQKIIISTIEDALTNSQKLYEGCVPYCNETGVFDSLFGECTTGLVKLRSNEQRGAISKSLRGRLAMADDLPFSDIVRTIATKSGDEFVGRKSGKVFIFSDMIENSDYIPGKIFWWQPMENILAKIRNDSYLPNLPNVKIRVFGVGRGGDQQRKQLPQIKLDRVKKFWAAYFKQTGATDVLIGESLSDQ